METTNKRPLTIFLDLDGSVIWHYGDLNRQITRKPMLIEGVMDKLIEFDRKGYNIIITTGRKESARKVTEDQLRELGIFYDQLVMNIGGGTRILINDMKPDSEEPTAIAFSIKRNEGIKDIKI